MSEPKVATKPAPKKATKPVEPDEAPVIDEFHPDWYAVNYNPVHIGP